MQNFTQSMYGNSSTNFLNWEDSSHSGEMVTNNRNQQPKLQNAKSFSDLHPRKASRAASNTNLQLRSSVFSDETGVPPLNSPTNVDKTALHGASKATPHSTIEQYRSDVLAVGEQGPTHNVYLDKTDLHGVTKATPHTHHEQFQSDIFGDGGYGANHPQSPSPDKRLQIQAKADLHGGNKRAARSFSEQNSSTVFGGAMSPNAPPSADRGIRDARSDLGALHGEVKEVAHSTNDQLSSSVFGKKDIKRPSATEFIEATKLTQPEQHSTQPWEHARPAWDAPLGSNAEVHNHRQMKADHDFIKDKSKNSSIFGDMRYTKPSAKEFYHATDKAVAGKPREAPVSKVQENYTSFDPRTGEDLTKDVRVAMNHAADKGRRGHEVSSLPLSDLRVTTKGTAHNTRAQNESTIFSTSDGPPAERFIKEVESKTAGKATRPGSDLRSRDYKIKAQSSVDQNVSSIFGSDFGTAQVTPRSPVQLKNGVTQYQSPASDLKRDTRVNKPAAQTHRAQMASSIVIG